MESYIQNKIISLCTIGLIIAVTYMLLGYTHLQWQVILLTILVFGYMHFIIGFYYQWRSFAAKKGTYRFYVMFVALALGSIALTEVLFVYAGFTTALFIGFLYFLFHGVLNEQTLLQRQAGICVPLALLVPISVSVIAILIYAVPDQTFFFSRTLVFESVPDFLMVTFFNEVLPPYITINGLFYSAAVLSFLWSLLAWYYYQASHRALGTSILIGNVVLCGVVYLFGAPPYIYMYVLVVGYHFVTWFLFYIPELRRRGGQYLQEFFLWHGILGLLLCLVAVLYIMNPGSFFLTALLDYQMFVTATFVHISTSFMNDQWFTRWLDRTWPV